MSLTPEQKATVSTWIAAGDNLSAVQKKLREQFQISMTYMDVRFLVDDLNLTLKDPAPKADTSDVTKAKAPVPAAKSAPPPDAATDATAQPADDADIPAEDAVEDDALPPVPGNVSVQVDGMTLDPRMIASGTVTFSDGVHGKWFVDQQGRPGLSEISQPGYRPSPEDAQAFMRELDESLRQKGF
ncbi:MAG: hypothetical protein H7067_10355 [Burkholderiales bacterium]|nr:hypothetical protein [Opitutaceae bacterium]